MKMAEVREKLSRKVGHRNLPQRSKTAQSESVEIDILLQNLFEDSISQLVCHHLCLEGMLLSSER